jgi:hypothetical protein
MSRKNGGTPLHQQISVLINEAQLNSLLKHGRSTSKQVAELTGSHREKIAYAKDKHGLHTGAFAIIKRWDRKEPEALLEEYTHLQAYLDLSGIREKMESVARLDIGEGEAGGKPAKVALLSQRRKAKDGNPIEQGQEQPA